MLRSTQTLSRQALRVSMPDRQSGSETSRRCAYKILLKACSTVELLHHRPERQHKVEKAAQCPRGRPVIVSKFPGLVSEILPFGVDAKTD